MSLPSHLPREHYIIKPICSFPCLRLPTMVSRIRIRNLTKWHSITVTWATPANTTRLWYLLDSERSPEWMTYIFLHSSRDAVYVFLSRVLCTTFMLWRQKERRTLFFIVTWCHFRSECHTQARRRFVRRNARCEIESDCATNWMVFWCLEINYPDSAAQEFPWKTLFPLVARFKVMRSGLRCLFTLSRACVSKRPKKTAFKCSRVIFTQKICLTKVLRGRSDVMFTWRVEY